MNQLEHRDFNVLANLASDQYRRLRETLDGPKRNLLDERQIRRTRRKMEHLGDLTKRLRAMEREAKSASSEVDVKKK